MPCPGSDKAFYREVGLAPPKAPPVSNDAGTKLPALSDLAATAVNPRTATPPQIECKPQIHKKTGGTLPCPAPE